MLTIYYHPNYGRQKKIFLTRKLRYSKFLIIFEYIFWKFNLALGDRFIYSGPRKLQNNLVKSFKNNRAVTFNNYKFPNSYIVQYDDYGKKIFSKVLKKFPYSNIIVGPLYDQKGLSELSNELVKNKNIKLCIASNSVRDYINDSISFNIPEEQIVVLPVGVIEEAKKIKKTRKDRKLKCLIYYKKRNKEELNLVIENLKNRKIDYKVFNYGTYNNRNLTKYAKEADFGIILDKTESQGIAVLEIMSRGLPLIVCEYSSLEVNGKKYNSTSVPYWSEKCGIKINLNKNFDDDLKNFINNLDKFKPEDFINEELTFTVASERLINKFN
tara:strand:+ start:265 stop:1242 length:978 start_codon:yes stop_codon:yes gene_type:complete